MWYIYTQRNIIWALKRNKILIHATTYVNHEDAMLKKKKVTKRQKSGTWNGGYQGLEGGENVKILFNGYRISDETEKMKRVT